MSYTRQNYPASFKMLKQDLVPKAIEIGNCLIKAGYKEDIAELIALSNAKLWFNYLAVQPGAAQKRVNVHLVPHPAGWALISGDASVFYFVCASKNDALGRARAFAKNEKLKLYIHALAGNISDSENFIVNRPVAGQHIEVPNTSVAPAAVYSGRSSFVEETRKDAVKRAKWLAKKIKSNFTRREAFNNRLSFDLRS